MLIYKVKSRKLAGTRWSQVYKKAFSQYKEIRSKTKRRAYIRSAYFDKQKIFLELFWPHLHNKENLRDKTRRIKFFPCAIELLIDCRYEPTSRENPNRKGEILHRFSGITRDGEVF